MVISTESVDIADIVGKSGISHITLVHDPWGSLNSCGFADDADCHQSPNLKKSERVVISTEPLDLHSGLPTSASALCYGGCEVSDKIALLTSIPTPPRMKTWGKAEIIVEDWLSSNTALDGGEHVPWGDLVNVLPRSWIAEGCLMAPEKFNSTLSEYHSKQRRKNLLVSCKDLTTSNLPIQGQQPKENRSSGLQAFLPPLPRMSTFFPEANPIGPPPSAPLPALPKTPKPEAASSSLLPATIPSAIDLVEKKSSGLAQRRGKKQPAALTLQPPQSVQSEHSPYPGIPTPFLGYTPTGISPKFDRVQNSTAQPPTLAEMVSNLHSLCSPASPAANTSLGNSAHSFLEPSHSANTSDNDEWAFAYELMKGFLEQDRLLTAALSREFSPKSSATPGVSSPVSNTMDLDSIDEESEGSSSTSDTSFGSPLRISRESCLLSSDEPVKGILKHQVSVRFAPSPNKKSPGRKRSSTLAPPAHGPKGIMMPPSPLRQCFVPDETIPAEPKQLLSSQPKRASLMRRASLGHNLLAVQCKPTKTLPKTISSSTPAPLISVVKVRRATINENDLRRTSTNQTPSRMVMPLKRMFTRFK